MNASILDDDILEDDGQDLLVNYPFEVQKAIDQVNLTSNLIKIFFLLKLNFLIKTVILIVIIIEL